MKRRGFDGFTIVELIIVIVVMGILLVLAVANLRNTQSTARDSQRTSDVGIIAQNLEAFYRNGISTSNSLGRYPSTAIIGNETTYLPDIDPKVLDAPGQSASSLVAASNNTQTTSGVAPQPTISQYVYQPLQQDGTLCTTEVQACQKFNLYFALENPLSTGTTDCLNPTGAVCMITSRNQ